MNQDTFTSIIEYIPYNVSFKIIDIFYPSRRDTIITHYALKKSTINVLFRISY